MPSRLPLLPRAASIRDRFWFAGVEPHGLAAFRILLGGFLFLYYLRYLPHVDLLFSNRGVSVPVVLPDIAPPPPVAWFLYVLSLEAVLLFTLGWRTAVLTPLVLASFLYHWCLGLAEMNTAYDRLIILFLTISCFARLDRAWALDAPARAAATVPAWPARLLCLQLALLYFGSGLWKLGSRSWRTGRILEMTMAGPWGTPAAFAFAAAGWPAWIYDVLTWGVILFELGAGFALHFRRTRKAAMAAGLLFHLGVWVFLDIPEFLVCATVYVLYLDPEAVRAAGERLGRRLGLRPRG
jgi:hypothetical protein